MTRFSASKASLLTKCKYPFRTDLETIHGTGTARKSEDARAGSALHRAAELYIVQAKDALDHALAEFGVAHLLPRLARQWGSMRAWIDVHPNLVAEAKFALDLPQEAARRLSAEGTRDYHQAGEGEIPMTLDILGFHPDGLPFLRDWKTGYSAEGYWPQIGVNALAVAYWLKAAHPDVWNQYQAVEGGILHVTGEGVDDSRVRLFDRYELAAIADDLRADLAAVPGAAPTPGPHCLDLHCPAFQLCPATHESVAAVEHLLPEESLVRRPGLALSPRIESADHAAWCKQQLRVFSQYAEEVSEAIDAFVGDQEHVLADGSILKRTFRNVSRLSVGELVALARAKGASDAEIASCTRLSRESAGIRVVKAKVAKEGEAA
jgi:PD-(D/E)XK nuclease superfamily